jgi:hypothetical protein
MLNSMKHRAIFEKEIVTKLVKKVVFSAIQRLITVFTTDRHWSLPELDENSTHPIFLRSILISSSLNLHILHEFLVPPMRATWSKQS